MTELVDVDRYPIHVPSGERCRTLVSRVRSQLSTDGCAVLSGFVRACHIDILAAEADRVAPNGHRNFSRTNAYFTQDDPSLPAEHPVRRFYDRSNAFVPADNFAGQSPLRELYQWPDFPSFVQAALGESEFHPYADPLADVIINTAEEGGGFPWHFDTNNFTVTLCIQNAAGGGEFEYCPGLRSATDENYVGVQAVLDGVSKAPRQLVLEPGDLQIFKGRYSLHRVKPLSGSRKRHVAIFSFVSEPGMVGSPERTRQLYGRVLPIHFEHAGRRADNLLD